MKYRKSNRSKQHSHSCRNNGSCNWCKEDRLHSSEVALQENIKDIPLEDLHPAEIRLIEHDAYERELKLSKCLSLIPNTFIMCGEGENYCSESCWKLAKLVIK